MKILSLPSPTRQFFARPIFLQTIALALFASFSASTGFAAKPLTTKSKSNANIKTSGVDSRPNIIFILTDDLGYGDVGVFFQNMRRAKHKPYEITPNIDAMAASGIMLPQHYSGAPVCAPARGSLLAGVTQGHAGIRDNEFDKALENNHTLATELKQAGYATAVIGKWGMQGTKRFPASEDTPSTAKHNYDSPARWQGYPTKRGFDYFFGYVRHSDGHEHYPHEGVYHGKKQVWENNREISAELAKCYTTDLWTAAAKKWIEGQHASHPKQPFFLYLAYDTPHAVTELPTMAYPAGSGLHGGVQWLGTPGHMINTATGKPDSYYYPKFANATYFGPSFGKKGTSNTSQQRPWPDVCKRYATVVQRIDMAVGDVEQLLKDLHIDKNTLVIFTSDNGPSPESYLKESRNHPDFFHSFGPYDGIKRDCWEGGWHMGAVVRWPEFVPGGRISETPSQSQDWMPTFAAVAGVPAPARTDGVSLLPTLTGIGTQIPSTIYTEYFYPGRTPGYSAFAPAHRKRIMRQMQAIRIGDYMGVRYNIKGQNDPFEIYNVMTDPQETKNLAEKIPALEQGEQNHLRPITIPKNLVEKMPALEQQMKDDVLQMRMPATGRKRAERPYDNALIPAIAVSSPKNGVSWRAYEGHFPWVPKLDILHLKPSASGIEAAPSIAKLPRKNDIAVLYTGYIRVPADGKYTFYLTADSGALLRIHDATVIDADFGYVANHEVHASVLLRAGMHPFRLYYNHNSTTPLALNLQWSGPGIEKQPIPASVYFSGTGINPLSTR